MNDHFQTLAGPGEIRGIGLHSGTKVLCRLLPRENAGVEFVRVDLPDSPPLLATARHITQTHHATVLQQHAVTVSTPEHLLAALFAMGISNCRIELDGAEVPILDGSSRDWCELIRRTGQKQLHGGRQKYFLKEPVLVTKGDGAVLGLPHSHLSVTVDVDYGMTYLGKQVLACDVSPQVFEEEIAPARTFARHDWIEPLRDRGIIRGGSVDNALVLGEKEPSSPLRFPNELARHKALDLLGDIALLTAADGGILCAHLIAVRAGHELHRLWMHEVLRMDALVL